MTKQKTREQLEIDANKSGLTFVSGSGKSHDLCVYKCLDENCGWVGEKYPSVIQQGRKCPRCSGRERGSGERTIAEAKLLNLEYLHGYTEHTKNCTFRCLVGDCGWEGLKTPQSISSGKGCPRCSGKERVGIDRVKSDALKLNLEYVSGYTKTHNKTTYKCLINGCGWVGEKTPDSVRAGHGCARCAGKERLFEERLNEDARKVGLQYDSGFITVDDKAVYTCLKCGCIIRKSPDSVKQGTGCPNCCAYGFNPNEIGYLYVYRINDYVGYGISNDHEDRLRKHKTNFNKHNADYEVIKVFEFGLGYNAAKAETQLKRTYTPVSDIEGFVTESAALEHLEEILSFVANEVDKEKIKVVN